MSHFLLSTYAAESGVPATAPSPEEMQAFMGRVIAVEAEMDGQGAFVFGGALHGTDAATVVSTSEGEVLMTDGPFVDAKRISQASTSSMPRTSMRRWPGQTRSSTPSVVLLRSALSGLPAGWPTRCRVPDGPVRSFVSPHR